MNLILFIFNSNEFNLKFLNENQFDRSVSKTFRGPDLFRALWRRGTALGAAAPGRGAAAAAAAGHAEEKPWNQSILNEI